MSQIKEFLNDPKRKQFLYMISIHDDWEKFESVGEIGDCLLRRSAKEFIKELGVDLPVVHIMKDIAFENYRNLFLYYREHMTELMRECNELRFASE